MPIRTAILTIKIGTGLAIDAEILSAILTKLGHIVEVHDLRDRPATFETPDCTIFLERFDPRWVGRFNVLVPNHEYVKLDELAMLRRFELIACKTREAERLLRDAVEKDRLIYTGWTSLDRFRVDVPRTFDECLHVAGCAQHKGTNSVLRAWEENPDLPTLNLIDWRTPGAVPQHPSNVHCISDRIDDESLIALMNRCGIHLCPSSIEGFGHTIHEAMSCGATLITTGAPPMNEQTQGVAIEVAPSERRPKGIGTAYEVSPSEIAAAVRKVLAMPREKRQALGDAARKQWQQNHANFVRSIENMARIIAQRLQQSSGVISAGKKPLFGSNMFRA